MTHSERRQPDDTPPVRAEDSSRTDRDGIQPSESPGMTGELEGSTTRTNDRPVESHDIDPDSAESQVDRDDMMTDS